MSKTILVTGAAGFIGSHLTDMLLARGDRVVGLDSFNPYYDPARKRANLAEVRAAAADPDAFEFVEGDIRDRDLLRRLFSAHGFDAVAHLAANGGVRTSVEQPHLYYDINLIGTLNLLEEARRVQLENFVFASTSSAYGNTTQIPFDEDDPCARPLAPYPATKRSAELLGHAYHHLHGVPFTALRLFTVYGPRGRPDMMPYKLLDNIYGGREVPLYNKGQMHRDWTFVGDIAQGFCLALDRPLGYEIINIGCGTPVLLAEFVRTVEAVTGRQTSLLDAPMHEADVAYTYAKLDKARTLLGYQPQVAVLAGVTALVKWYEHAVVGT